MHHIADVDQVSSTHLDVYRTLVKEFQYHTYPIKVKCALKGPYAGCTKQLNQVKLKKPYRKIVYISQRY